MNDNLSRNQAIIDRRLKGHGPRRIAKDLDLSPSIVSGVLHRSCMTSQPRGRGFGLTRAEVAKLKADRAEGLTFTQIGEANGVHRMTAFKYARDARA